MTITEARIRRRLFGTRDVQVFISGHQVFSDDDVVKVRYAQSGVRVWTLWDHDDLNEWWFPQVDEVRVAR